MKFKSEKDRIMINKILAVACAIVPRIVKNILKEMGLQVQEEGEGMQLVYIIKSNAQDFNAKFCFHNLLLEIATRDRDSDELQFDEGLFDFGFFLYKAGKIIESKIKPLMILTDEGAEKGTEKIKKLTGYERIRILKKG